MRTLTALLIAAFVLTGTAFAEQGFVIDARDPDSQGKVFTFVDGELESSEPLEPTPLLVLTLQGGPFDGEVMLFSVHNGETLTWPLSRPNGTGGKELYGVLQIREFGSAAAAVQRKTAPTIDAMLERGRRFMIDNVELVIYVPGSKSFRAELLSSNLKENELGKVEVSVLPSPDASRPIPPAMNSLGWISGSL